MKHSRFCYDPRRTPRELAVALKLVAKDFPITPGARGMVFNSLR